MTLKFQQLVKDLFNNKNQIISFERFENKEYIDTYYIYREGINFVIDSNSDYGGTFYTSDLNELRKFILQFSNIAVFDNIKFN